MMGEWQGGADTPLAEARCGTTSNSCPNLPCGQNCLYTYKADESSDMKILGVHYTPAKRYSDSFNYELTSLDNGNKCGVKGYSTSDTWYAVLDFGTNFCNIRNLLDGVPGVGGGVALDTALVAVVQAGQLVVERVGVALGGSLVDAQDLHVG